MVDQGQYPVPWGANVSKSNRKQKSKRPGPAKRAPGRRPAPARPAVPGVPVTARVVGWVRTNFPIVRFVLTTAVLLVALYILLHQRWVETHFVDPYTGFVAEFSRVCLRLIGIEAAGTGFSIVSPEFSVTIKNVCNGLEVTAIFLAVTLGFPATWKHKLLGLLIGYPVIFLINIVRIVVLFVLGFKVPNVFEAAHFYYAQAFVIIATVGVWLLWVSMFSAYGSKTRHRLSD
jgi:exosortase H (IPTLxxWG-CTERM-specific)